jgi:hypothetical protein
VTRYPLAFHIPSGTCVVRTPQLRFALPTPVWARRRFASCDRSDIPGEDGIVIHTSPVIRGICFLTSQIDILRP